MKFPALLLGFTLVCCVVLAGYIHSKRKQEIHLSKQASFLNIKFRVTRDVLGEYQDQLSQSAVMLENTKKVVNGLTTELSDVTSLVEKKNKEVMTCKEAKKLISDDLAAAEAAKRSDQNEFVRQKLRWADEEVTLNKKASETSKLCAYIDNTSVEARKLCGMRELPKPEPKVEQPKPQEPKVEQPKPQEPKVEQPKPQEPKVEQPKPQEPKVEQPKPQEPKAEQPKPQEPKVEQPKPQEPKVEQPKPQEPKAEQPKPQEPEVEQPKPQEPKVEQPKAEQPKPEEPKAEPPKPEEPKAKEP